MAQPHWKVTAQREPLEAVLVSLHYVYPTVVFVYFIVSSSVAVCTLQTVSENKHHPRRRLILYLMLFSVLTYLAQVCTVLLPSLAAERWFSQQDAIIGLLSSILVFGVQLAALSDAEKPVWYPYIGTYLLALVFEPILAVLSLLARPPRTLTYYDVIGLFIVAARYLAIVLVVGIYFIWKTKTQREQGGDSEIQPLLQKNGMSVQASEESGESQNSSYGSTSESSDSSTDASQSPTTTPESPWQRREREARDRMEKRLKENGNWLTYAKSFLVFIPYIWPVNNRPLQLRAVLVGVCLLANNALNVLIPRQLGIVTDSLNHYNESNPWVQVAIFAALRFSASEAGLSLIRQWLWIPVEFYSFGAMSTAAYSHVLNLSCDFHDSKSSSDIMMAIQSGQSVSNLLEQICFSAIPMLIDMGVAFVYLSVTFGPYEGLITLATAIVFLYVAGRMISSLKTARRSEVGAWFEEHYVRQAGIQGWSTVTSFNQIGHEERRYTAAVQDRITKTQNVYIGYIIAYAFQYLILLSGLLAGAFLAVYQVTAGQATPGQFIMLLTYWAQLVAPLNFFANLGKNVSRDLIHAEQLLDIMRTKPTVVNKEDADELKFVGGEVRFNHVYFSYDNKKQILKDIDLSVDPGTTVAFVGATGAGKSTILKLLDRFYDVTGGSIEIDGQDIRDVDIYSLRGQIGIVPQAPILFDDTIMNNVRYAKLDAIDDEIFLACKAACIHDQITGFSDGYNTRVGERGIKLSGGELQRVAIARAILKSPSIVLLDEATSSVDTETEQKIQEALQSLCHGRTTFVVAHRLSTVMNADCIVVVNDGTIVEKGSHEDLIRADGKYAELWSKQIFVKPKKNGGKDGDDAPVAKKHNKQANIVNDLTVEATTTELAKVKSVEAPPSGSGGDGEEDAGESQAEGTKTPSGHKKEASKLNPDAPTFTPRTFAAAVAHYFSYLPAPGAPPADPPGRAMQRRTDEMAEVKPPAQMPPGVVDAPAGVMEHPARIPPQPPTLEVARGEESHDTRQASGSQATVSKAGGSGGKTKSERVRWKRPRYSRRVQSKSEPSSAATVNDA